MVVMRTAFDFGTRKNLGHWFPRHMGKGIRQMRALLRKVDCVIEVHDCRIPLTGRNPVFPETLSSKPRLLVLNKSDMAKLKPHELDKLDDRLLDEGTHDYMLTSCLPGEGGALHLSIAEIIPRCVDIIEREERYDREGDAAMDMMIVGIPNVGKSSLINALRRQYLRKASIQRSVARSPGHTRSVMFKTKVCEKPLIHLHDTPGILEAKIRDLHSGMKLAMCNTLQDHLVGTAMIADYLLYVLNQKKEFQYVERYSLKEPNDEIQPLLYSIALRDRKYQTRKLRTGTGTQHLKIPDYEYAASRMLFDFREGHLGRFIVDDLSFTNNNQSTEIR